MKTLYTAHATTIGGRDGTAKTSDRQLSLKLATPGGNKSGTNPEQLFACGYSACFGSAVQHVAKLKNITTGQIEVKADVGLNQDDEGFFINVALDVTLAGVDDSTAQTLVQEAHKVCPYSKATRGNIEVSLRANGQNLREAA